MRLVGIVVAALLITTLSTSTDAAAQPATVQPQAPPAGAAGAASAFGPPSELAAPPAFIMPAPLSESTALGLSLGVTAGSWLVLISSGSAGNGSIGGLALLGTFLGPSTGHWYRGSYLTRGMGIRLIGMVVTAYGIVQALRCEDGCADTQIGVSLLGGLAIYAGGTLDDIMMAPRRVREHNQRLQQVQLAPMVTPRGAGLAIGGRF